jgi:hypothetical protein
LNNENKEPTEVEKSSLDRDEMMPVQHLKIFLVIVLGVFLFSLWLVYFLLPK